MKISEDADGSQKHKLNAILDEVAVNKFGYII